MGEIRVNERREGIQKRGDVYFKWLNSIVMVFLLPIVLFSSPIVALDHSAGIDDDDEPVARSEPSEPSKETIDPKKKLEKEQDTVAEEITVLE